MDPTDLPDSCDIKECSVLLLKLGSATHSWDSGQQIVDIPIVSTAESSLDFTVPDSEIRKIVPAFYHLFYVDCHGKLTVSPSVRFDDTVGTVTGRAEPSANS
jgi:hypothetical protein